MYTVREQSKSHCCRQCSAPKTGYSMEEAGIFMGVVPKARLPLCVFCRAFGVEKPQSILFHTVPLVPIEAARSANLGRELGDAQITLLVIVAIKTTRDVLWKTYSLFDLGVFNHVCKFTTPKCINPWKKKVMLRSFSTAYKCYISTREIR